MTSRFERFMLISLVVLIGSALVLPILVFPSKAAAQEPGQNKQRQVFEIKNFPRVYIPIEEKIVLLEPVPYQIPPKVNDDERAYMHEPQIRAYICPKMGQAACNIFIAVLKAENGTHECTRDNRGLNRNGSIDVGLAQINWNANYHPPYTVEQLRDCKFNLDIALKKYQARGFQPWYAYTKGAYKKFLKPVAVITAASVE